MSPIRVLIVEDSVTQREIFRRLLASDGEFAIVAEARNGQEAIELVRRHPLDVVLMDIHMPEMDGIAATREIMSDCPVPIVVASATLKRHEIDLAMQAYEAGAVSVIEKPDGAALLHLHKIGPELRRELIVASQAKLKPAAAKPTTSSTISASLPARRVDVIGICASTGGPPVLLEILGALRPGYPVPMLLVQHISRGFEAGFAHWLSQMTRQPVALATSGQRLLPGVWLATNGRHLTLGSGGRMYLPTGASNEIHAPSGDRLFESLAKNAGPKAAGVVLTGMGDDGAAGLLSLRQAGGLTMIQEESSCMIWGMPKAARENGAAMREFKPAEIAATLAGLAAQA